MKCATFLTVLLLFVSAYSNAETLDRIELKNGDVYRGSIIEHKFGAYIQLRLSDGNEKRLLYKEISKIEKEEQSLTQAPLTDRGIASASGTPSPSPWSMNFSFGMTLSNSSTYTYKNNTGSTLLSSSDSGKTSALVEAGIQYKEPDSPFAIGLTIPWNQYNYTDNTESDSHFGFLVLPKGYFGGGSVKGWIALGAGLSFASIGTNSISVNGTTVTFDKTASSFALSPRVGIDFLTNDEIVIQAQFYYFTTSSTLGGSATSNGNTATFSTDVTRSWWVFALGTGFFL